MISIHKKRWFPGALLLTIGIVLTSAYLGRKAYCLEHIYEYPEWHYVAESKTYRQSDKNGKNNIAMSWAEWHVQKEIGRFFAWAILPFFIFGFWALFIDFRDKRRDR